MTLPDKQHLLWQCRRGMLELDLLLEQFLETSYDSLDDTDRIAFVSLLKENDQDLYGWLFGGIEPLSKETKRVIDLVRGGKKEHIGRIIRNE